MKAYAVQLLWLLSLLPFLTSCQNQETNVTAFKKIPEPFKGCRVLFNEVDFAGTEKYKNFIELAKYCDISPSQNRNFDMGQFKIVVIDAIGFVIAVCKLKGRMTHRPSKNSRNERHQYFYVVGDRTVNNVDLPFEECQLDISYGVSFPFPKDYPLGLALIRSPKIETLDSIKLAWSNCENPKCHQRRLNFEDLKKIVTYLQDFIVVGSVTPYVNCKIFQNIYGQYTNKPDALLRDWAGQNDIGRSISRCGRSTLPMHPEEWRYTVPSSGTRNNCDGAVTFNLDRLYPLRETPQIDRMFFNNSCEIINVVPEAAKKDDIPILNVEELDLGLDVETEPDVDFEEINEEIEIEFENEDNIDCDNTISDLEEQSQLEDINDYMFNSLTIDSATKYIDDDCEKYTPLLQKVPEEDVDKIIFQNSSVCWWFEFKQHSLQSKASATCKICNKLYTNHILVDRPKSSENSKFVTVGDWNSDAPRKRRANKNLIENHLASGFHQISTQFYTHIDEGLRDKELLEKMMSPDGAYFKYYEATANLALMVHTATSMGLPFNRFGQLMEPLRKFNAPVGYVHHNSAGAAKMLSVISGSLKKELVFHLLKNKPKLCIIIDGSTDMAGMSNAVILFQTWDGNTNPRVTVYHYHLIHLKYGERGAAYFKALEEQLQKDKLKDFVKSNTIAMTSDGASSMKSTFFNELKTFTGRELIHIHCYSHRLELSMKSVLTKEPFIKYIDKRINRIQSYFGRKAAKKRSLLRRNMVERNITQFAVVRVIEERWVSSRNRAYSKILKHWKLLVDTLTDIEEDLREYEPEDRSTATSLKNDLRDPTFLAYIAFLSDVTSEYVTLSLDFQRKNASLIGKYVQIESLKTKLTSISEHGGENLRKLLIAVFTVNPEFEYPESITEQLGLFESSPSEYEDTHLIDPQEKNQNVTLFTLLYRYMDGLKLSVDEYFPANSFQKQLNIFYPPNFPRDLEDNKNHDYGKNDLEALNEIFKWHTHAYILQNQFSRLIYKIVGHEKFVGNLKLTPEKFWQFYLEIPEMEWTEVLREIIKFILTISPSSSDAERSFSYVTATKTTGRYNLKTETVDRIIRVKTNSEKNIDKVNCFSYARQFVKRFCKADEKGRARPQFQNSYAELDSKGKSYETIFQNRLQKKQ